MTLTAHPRYESCPRPFRIDSLLTQKIKNWKRYIFKREFLGLGKMKVKIILFGIFIVFVGFLIFFVFKSPNVSAEIAKCNKNTEDVLKNDCLTNLAINKSDVNICDKVSEGNESREVCAYQYVLKTNDKNKEVCYNPNGPWRCQNSSVCQNITDPKIQSECMIYTAGYSEDELKQVLLENELSLDVNVRIFGIKKLTGFSCQNVEFLLQMANDQDSLIRFKSIQYIGDNQCYLVNLALNQDEVINKIKAVYYNESDSFVQAQIIHTLGKIGNKKAIPFIKELLDGSSTSDFMKIACLTALGEIGNDESLDMLDEFKDSNNELLRINARTSINKITKCVEKGVVCLPLKANPIDVSSCPSIEQDGGYCFSHGAQVNGNISLCYLANDYWKSRCVYYFATSMKNVTLCNDSGSFKEACDSFCANNNCTS